MDKLERFGRILRAARAAFVAGSLATTLLAISVSCSSVAADAIPAHCDRGLEPIDGVLGYRPRSTSDICEGLYRAKFSASLEVVSYLTGRLDFDPKAHRTLDISIADIPELTSEEIFVRAVALPAGTYYRMDSTLVSPDRIGWSLDEVIGPGGLEPSQLGVFGWVGTELEKTFVPLHVAPRGERGVKNGHASVLLIRPTVDVEYVTWRAWTETEPHTAEGELEDGGFAGWPFPVLIPNGPAVVLNVEVNAKEANRTSWLPTVRLRVWRAPR